MAQNLSELHPIAFVHQEVADAAYEVKSQLNLATTLDSTTPENLDDNVASGDRMRTDGKGSGHLTADTQSSRGVCRAGWATMSTILAVITGISHTGLCLIT